MNITGLLILLAVGLALFHALLIVYTAQVLTRPPRRGYAWAVARGIPGDPAELSVEAAGLTRRGLQFAPFSFAARNGRLPLPGWSVEGLDDRGPIIIISHGWGDSRVVMLSRSAVLAPLASRLILWDMAGHGDAPGRCTLGTREPDDLLELLREIDALPGVPPQRPLLLYGYSLGAGVAIAAAAGLAADRAPARLAGVIAEAPYALPRTPARNVLALRGLPWRANLRPALHLIGLRHGLGWGLGGTRGAAARFDRAAAHHAGALAIPLLVLHGDADAICPSADGRAIAAAAERSGRSFVRTCVVPGAGHTDLFVNPEFRRSAARAIAGFIADASASPDARRPHSDPSPVACG